MITGAARASRPGATIRLSEAWVELATLRTPRETARSRRGTRRSHCRRATQTAVRLFARLHGELARRSIVDTLSTSASWSAGASKSRAPTPWAWASLVPSARVDRTPAHGSAARGLGLHGEHREGQQSATKGPSHPNRSRRNGLSSQLLAVAEAPGRASNAGSIPLRLARPRKSPFPGEPTEPAPSSETDPTQPTPSRRCVAVCR